ncbi:hypothetical protein ACJJTC_018432 [Scirpophaga incertulas]
MRGVFIIFLFVLKWEINEIKTSNAVTRINYIKNRSNIQELSKFIEYLNKVKTNVPNFDNQEHDSYKIFDLMKILQKNYDVGKQMRNKIRQPAVRLYVIKNPKVLEKYQKKLMRK